MVGPPGAMPARETITSTRNPAVVRFRDAAAGRRPGEMVADGYRLVWDAVRSELAIPLAAFSPKLVEHRGGWDLRRRLEQCADEVLECSDRVVERMSSLTTHQGVLAVLERPGFELGDLAPADRPALVVAAGGVRDPGNLGAIVRTAEAAGATGFVALAGSADPFRDKAVRGSCGSVFRLPTLGAVELDALRAWAKAAGLQIVAADASADADYLSVDLTPPTVLVLGGEAGLSEEVVAAADRLVRIATTPAVESLNVAVAAGVLMFEARRQRQ